MARLGSSPLRGVLLFVLITIVFHLLWRLGRDWIESRALYQLLSDASVQHVYQVAATLSRWLLGDVVLRLDDACTLQLAGRDAGGPFTGYLVVNHACSGLKQFYQALVLFVLYPGPWRHKLWYVPLALLAMHLVNIMRIVALAATMAWQYQHWDLMHDWVLRPLFYVVLFGLWVLWEERFHNPRRKPKPQHA